MPSYTFECGSCGHVETDIRPMSDATDAKLCGVCGTSMHRLYKFSTKSDEYKEPLHLITMKPVWGNGPVGKNGKVNYDVVHSDSERERWRQDYERKYKQDIRPTC